MNDSQPHLDKPTAKQQRYLRDLAQSRGESFVHPQTRAEASAQIDRLKGRKRTSADDHRREARALSRDMAERRGDAASVRADELQGYGSSATWA